MADIRLADIMDTGLLAQMLQERYIRAQVHPDDPRLHILNYTEKAQFDRVWNDATRQCRGLAVAAEEEEVRTAAMLKILESAPGPRILVKPQPKIAWAHP